MINKKTGKTENRWSRKATQAFLLFVILTMTPGLMGMAGTDSSPTDPPRRELFAKPTSADKTKVPYVPDLPENPDKPDGLDKPDGPDVLDIPNKPDAPDGDEVARKTNRSLADYAISRLGTGYVYGTYGQVLTESLLAAKLNQYPLQVSPHLSYIQDNWLGKPAQDCCGLIKGHYWTDDKGKIVYQLNGLPDVSANGDRKSTRLNSSH